MCKVTVTCRCHTSNGLPGLVLLAAAVIGLIVIAGPVVTALGTLLGWLLTLLKIAAITIAIAAGGALIAYGSHRLVQWRREMAATWPINPITDTTGATTAVPATRPVQAIAERIDHCINHAATSNPFAHTPHRQVTGHDHPPTL